MLINADLKQIEVCIFAHLCKDPLLIKLLNEGKDIHKFIGSNVYQKLEEDITIEERNDAKTSTFGIIYGNGSKTLSERTGRTQEWAGEFITEFYTLFPKAKEWHDQIIKTVNQTGHLKIFTGEILKFRKYPSKYEWQKKQGIIESYNPPDIKNYPVQHLAWIISSIMLGQFWRKKALHKRDKYLMINTVHDSMMLDCCPEYIEESKQDIQEIVDNIPNIMLELFNEQLLVPIKIDISVGERWSDL